MTEVGRAWEKGETDGFTKVLVDAETLSIAAMCVGTPDRSPVAVHRCHATPMTVLNREP
jgi:pyruvate/2-oxoglutarate dehydrogenase complex dihydrolipoamide dehydrogenase (E3) component